MLNLVAQKKHNECHLGVVSTLMSAYDKTFSYKDAKNELKGNSFYEIENFLINHGIEAISYHKNKEELLVSDWEFCICHIVNFFSSHFILLEKENNTIYYYDSANYHRHKLTKNIIKHMSGYTIDILTERKLEKPNTFFQIHFKTRFFALIIAIDIILALIIF